MRCVECHRLTRGSRTRDEKQVASEHSFVGTAHCEDEVAQTVSVDAHQPHAACGRLLAIATEVNGQGTVDVSNGHACDGVLEVFVLHGIYQVKGQKL